MKVGIFGGSFNPPHLGHLNSLQTVMRMIGLEKIHVVPAAQSPLKRPTEGPNPAQRLDLVKLSVKAFGDVRLICDDQEIVRGGKSFTIDTVRNLRKNIEAKNLFLIMGADAFEHLDQWKDVQEILKETNIVVTSRPGFHLPETTEDLPKFLQSMVEEFEFNFAELKTGRQIQFIKLKDVEVSSTEIRKALRVGRSVDKFLALGVEEYILKENLYPALQQKIKDYNKFTEFCGQILYSKKAVNVRGFDLGGMSYVAEYALVGSGTSTKHTSSLAENLVQAVKKEYNIHPLNVEGVGEGRWVAIDYGSLIVHVFYDFVRNEYAIEKIFEKGKDLMIKEDLSKVVTK